MVKINYPQQYQIQIIQNWQDRKELLLYTSIILGFSIIGSIYSQIESHQLPSFYLLLLIVLSVIVLSNLLPVASLTFDIEKNLWEIRHHLLFIPTRLHTGQILNVSSLVVVKNMDKTKSQSQSSNQQDMNQKTAKKIKVSLELWGFEKQNGTRDKFLAFNHNYQSDDLADKGIIKYVDIGTEIINFFKKFQIPIDLETFSREIQEVEN